MIFQLPLNVYLEKKIYNNSTRLSRHEQGCLIRLRFERYFSYHREELCSWYDKLSLNILNFLPWFPALPPLFPTFFAFPPRFSALPRWFPAPALPSHSLHSHRYSLHYPHAIPKISILAFTDSQFSLCPLVIYFRKIVALVQKRTLPFVTTA